MKHFWIRDKRGLTLLEVVMACVLLPVIVYAGTNLALGTAGISGQTNATLDFMMKMDTVFMKLEQELVNVPAIPPNYPQVVWTGGNIQLQLNGPLNNNAPLAGYNYAIATQTLSNINGEILSSGVLLPDAPLEVYDANGVISSVDGTARTNCLNQMTQAACQGAGVNVVFGVAKDQNSLDFSFRSARQLAAHNQHGFTKSIPLAK